VNKQRHNTIPAHVKTEEPTCQAFVGTNRQNAEMRTKFRNGVNSENKRLQELEDSKFVLQCEVEHVELWKTIK
jgi:hypothetical protein